MLVAVSAVHERQVQEFVSHLENDVEAPSREFQAIVKIGDEFYYIAASKVDEQFINYMVCNPDMTLKDLR